ncbi:hypothetical protein K431DRAFT_259967 [Polychaeton citri CBS 116435]|uniref:Zn(2)-C6 fungal-type domain-containing protein n=1 Tax=Polychaeton citri CBS 116435 TaxID=1314669 RepID=A0A9P4URU4_9PEZI|nr:hypothetical protein K431DRAFT_259967 [Polychaeton citri CBS 116435]
MSAVISRANGRQASCEPCRKSKIRCDHEKPVCARCRRRGLQARCWYNPSPMTRARSGPDGANDVPSSTRSSRLPPNANPDEVETRSDRHHVVRPTGTDHNDRSHSSILRPGNQTSRGSDHNEKIRCERLAIVTKILGEMRHLQVIEELLNEYFSQVALVPKILISRIASAVREDPAFISLICPPVVGSSNVLPQLVDRILLSTAAKVDITPGLDIESFCSLYCGGSLRVETLGLICTVAARSLFHKRYYDLQEPDKFIQMLFRCSNLSLRLARDVVSQTNDVLVWLAYENMLLATIVEGDASLGVWQRLGDLSSDVYALGLHRETSLSAQIMPFFLSELRRRTYASAYQADKMLAHIFDRPPRIPGRYSDCKMPLDLADEELFGKSPDILKQARGRLSHDGWGTDEKYRSTTWARLRYIVGEFREETTEYSFFSLASDDLSKLRELSGRCHSKWDALPSHLHYNEGCWNSDLPRRVCMMLAKVYLSYLHVDFQIHRMLAKHHPDSLGELWAVSAKMLQTFLQVVKYRDRDCVSPRDLPTVVLAYGLPPAIVLTAALQDILRDDSCTLPLGLNWSMLVRSLSVFNSHLESICGPGQLNHEFCVHASKKISKTLDEILESLASSPTRTAPVGGLTSATIQYTSPSALPALGVAGDKAPINTAVANSATWDYTAPNGSNDAMTLNDIDALSGPDLADWAMNIDWTGTDSVWNTL